MSLKMMYITNSPEIAIMAENAGVDRIWIDLEQIGKKERQMGMHTVQSRYALNDIAVRQTVFIDGFGTWSSSDPINMFAAPIPKGHTLKKDQQGFHCCISSWERISDRNISPKVKVGANYIDINIKCI